MTVKGFKIPLTKFKVREGDVVLEQGCSFDEGVWTEKTTDDYFKDKRVVLFSCLLYTSPSPRD